LTAASAESDDAAGESSVVGVAMEVGLAGGSCLVYGLRDGTASLYFSTGGGILGGQGRPTIHAAAKKFVRSARELVTRLPLVREHPLPSLGRVRFSIFTPEGVRAAEAEEAELVAGRGDLALLFKSANDLLTRFRLMQASKPPAEPNYLNCLLTALARGTASSVKLSTGERLPDPADLTADVLDVEYIVEQEFDFDHLSVERVVAMILKLAGIHWFHFGKKEFRTRLAAHGGGSLKDVAFRVERRKLGDRVDVVITRLFD
jgi:hypothetical protein